MANSSNSGVEGASGYTFQRCCVVYLLFDGFQSLKDSDYFVCVEHHEDFLFAFLDGNKSLVKVDTYQAKKSRDDWTTDKEFCDIVRKITLVGRELVNDRHSKSDSYEHTLNFLTNRNILLKGRKEPKKKMVTEKVQATNNYVYFSGINEEIKKNIISKIPDGEIVDLSQLENIVFKYIDLPQTNRGWKQTLTGLSSEVFGDKINDHEAVITTLMKLLQDVELTYNNNGFVSLEDKNKQLTKNKIDSTFSMLVESKKSFKFWRTYSEELSKGLEIKLPIKRKAKELLDNCFDFFKDIQQVEYRKIYKFIEARVDIDERHESEAECIIELYQTYMSDYKPRLESHMVAFAVIAAYVETRGMYV